MPAGYSGTPQRRKLGLDPGTRVAFDNAPSGWGLEVEPQELVLVEDGGAADVVLSFFTSAAQIPARLPALAQRIYPDGALWVAWPRRAGGHHSDITDNVIRAHALPVGLVDVKVAAIDDDWSGLRVVWRTKNR